MVKLILEEAFSNEKVSKTIKIIDLVPKQKYLMPMTASQEIGWFNSQMVIFYFILFWFIKNKKLNIMIVNFGLCKEYK